MNFYLICGMIFMASLCFGIAAGYMAKRLIVGLMVGVGTTLALFAVFLMTSEIFDILFRLVTLFIHAAPGGTAL